MTYLLVYGILLKDKSLSEKIYGKLPVNIIIYLINTFYSINTR
jgi:hypothetical protein